MSKKIIFYEFFLFWQLSQVLGVYYDTQCEDFKKYVINSLNHIRIQNGWDSIQQSEIKLEYLTINTETVTSQIIDESNFIQKLYYLTYLLNCEFTNTMQTFNVMLGLVLNKCEVKYLINKQYDQLGYCTRLIIYIFNFSINMFNEMLKVLKYLDKVDLRIIDSAMVTIKTVDSEINYFHTYAIELSNISLFELPSTFNWVNTFENIKHFNKKAELIISNLYKNRKVCGTEHESSILDKLLMKYNIDQMEKLVEDSNEFINDIFKDLELYFTGIIENCYSKLGFEHLESTNTFVYIHSKRRIYGYNEGIVLCNHFISQTGWMSWKHISVKTEFTNGKSLYFKDIISTVDKENYYFVRTYLSLILRCRYIEIFHNFNIMLGHIVNVCKYENKINCAVKLYETLMTSDGMFKKMLVALITLKHYTKDKKCRHRELLLEKMIEFFIDYLNDVRKKYVSLLLFTKDRLYEASMFLEEVSHIQSLDLQIKLKHVIKFNLKYCNINKCDSDIDLTTFECSIKNNTLTEYSTTYQTMCNYLESFVLKVVKNDYEYLGFNNLLFKN
ncbi:uncharacterized protein LOC126908874 [Daktulosphaira vitifoliae]|uniref:uncharacterized protein LOC126908874 n=1 Tax=Daktulosphaira vitifoliae TaxID=58002 RepID=UPI0021AAAE2F|nr:uncharacterized protein LOC126908874 [Daktulosphaira vitifoliae]